MFLKSTPTLLVVALYYVFVAALSNDHDCTYTQVLWYLTQVYVFCYREHKTVGICRKCTYHVKCDQLYLYFILVRTCGSLTEILFAHKSKWHTDNKYYTQREATRQMYLYYRITSVPIRTMDEYFHLRYTFST